MAKIYDNISNEVLHIRTYKKAKEIAKNRCKQYKIKTCLILGKDTITIAEVVL